METLFGNRFVNSQLEEVNIDSLSSVKFFLIYFTASWCPPCNLFTKDLINIYTEINQKEKMFEIIQISNEKTEKDFIDALGDKPWLFVKYNDPLIEVIVNEYKITQIPQLKVINRERFILSDNGRRDMSELGNKAYEKWYKAFKVQKERELDIAEHNHDFE